MWFSNPVFSVDGLLCFCSSIDGLSKCLSQNHDLEECRLFIDSFKRSLKAVLLHNANPKQSILIAHSIHLRESYENLLLHAIDFERYSWKICGDLKAIGMSMRIQSGFTKKLLFLVFLG